MTDPQHTYRFVIDAWDPRELPMGRLAEYMGDLSRLFGEGDHVHFDRLEPGSTVLVQHVDGQALDAVQERLAQAGSDNAPEELAKCYRVIDERLAEDDASGSLLESSGAEILRFPGHERPRPPMFGPFRQDGCFDGMLIRVGGKDDTVPVHLQDGDVIHRCNANRDMARRLAPHLYNGTIRVTGNGRWKRDAEGHWILVRFDIKDFEVLDDRSLPDLVRQLRSVPGSGWRNADDPLAELRRLREEADSRH